MGEIGSGTEEILGDSEDFEVQEYLEYEIDDFDDDKIFNSKFFILTSESKTAEYVIKSLLKKTIYEYGVLITTHKKYSDFYLKDPAFDKRCLYTGYFPPMEPRCFLEHMFLIFDGNLYRKMYEVTEKVIKNMFFMITDHTFYEDFKYDFVIIMSCDDRFSLKQIHTKYLSNDEEFSDFIEFVELCLDAISKDRYIVIDVNVKDGPSKIVQYHVD